MTWIIVILFAALAFWGLAQAVVHRLLTVDETTLSVFKLMLRHRGLDVGRLPDAALIDIIVLRIEQAKERAVTSGGKRAHCEDWQRYLFRLLDEEADLIERLMRDVSERSVCTPTVGILLRYRALEPSYPPALSVEQFIEASKRGTLFAELEERIAKREFS